MPKDTKAAVAVGAARSDEEKIIESLILEGKSRLYEDNDFMPIRQSLYNVKTVIPEYDLEYIHKHTWCRPYTLSDKPCFFSDVMPQRIAAVQGALPDTTFLSALLAVATYTHRDLMPYIIRSSPRDFVDYGVYTCRFYVHGEWVEIVTDTNILCVKNETTDATTPAYASSLNASEMWVALLEKAYAKAVGSFEAMTRIKINEALVHLTGGSVQQFYIHGRRYLEEDSTHRNATVTDGADQASDKDVFTGPSRHLDLGIPGALIRLLQSNIKNDTLLLCLPIEARGEAGMSDLSPRDPSAAMGSTAVDDDMAKVSVNNPSSTADEAADVSSQSNAQHIQHAFFLKQKYYSICAVRDISGFELILMHNPWAECLNCWNGEFSDRSTDWDQYRDILEAIESDPEIPWTRKRPNGYFWIPAKTFCDYFNSIVLCKLFPEGDFKYNKFNGQWIGQLAGGKAELIRNRSDVVKDAASSRLVAFQKSTAAAVVDGDACWFNNPQYTASTGKACLAYVSLIPVASSSNDGMQYCSLSITKTAKSSNTLTRHLWDASLADLVAAENVDGAGRAKGQETSLWQFKMEPHVIYHIVPHTVKRDNEASYLLRVFSTHDLVIEPVDPLFTNVARGEWRKANDLETIGGPVYELKDGVKVENVKWCHNPQYHIEVVNPYGRDEIHIKIVVRRVDKQTGKTGKNNAAAKDKKDDAKAPCIGLTVSKAECMEEGVNPVQARKKQPRLNPMGELIPQKVSTLKKKASVTEDAMPTKNDSGKTILRKSTVLGDSFFLESTYTSKSDAAIYFPKIPRSWIPNGLIISPSLSSSTARGAYQLSVYSSEAITLNQLPDSYSRALAGEWTENNAGGSPLGSVYKTNPKFVLKFKNTGKSTAPARVRVCLTRVGSDWKKKIKSDAVGCMIGFSIYKHHARIPSEHKQILDPSFVPDDSVFTEPTFVLEQLGSEEEYVIVPSTFAEGKLGPFVLSVISEYEIVFHKHA